MLIQPQHLFCQHAEYLFMVPICTDNWPGHESVFFVNQLIWTWFTNWATLESPVNLSTKYRFMWFQSWMTLVVHQHHYDAAGSDGWPNTLHHLQSRRARGRRKVVSAFKHRFNYVFTGTAGLKRSPQWCEGVCASKCVFSGGRNPGNSSPASRGTNSRSKKAWSYSIPKHFSNDTPSNVFPSLQFWAYDIYLLYRNLSLKLSQGVQVLGGICHAYFSDGTESAIFVASMRIQAMVANQILWSPSRNGSYKHVSPRWRQFGSNWWFGGCKSSPKNQAKNCMASETSVVISLQAGWVERKLSIAR